METADSFDRRSGLLYSMMVIAAIAVIMLSLAGIAMVLGWMPGAVSGGGPASAQGADRPRAAGGEADLCGECGVVESIAAVKIEKNLNHPISYRIRVRMNDGTYRTVLEQGQSALSAGQRVRVTARGIAAAN
jgi:outer membrane lipoprotein SlyB